MVGGPGVFTCIHLSLKVQIMSQNIFARTGTEDGAKDRRKKT
jgi:hypothetical protein